MIRNLAEIGKKFGFKVWCPDRNKDSVLKETCETDLRLNIDTEKLERIKQIDVVWFKDNNILSIFEVENSTAITSALERGSNLPNSELIKKHILIPKERTTLFSRKMKEPMFNEFYQRGNWKVGFYQDLEVFVKKRNQEIDDFGSIFKQTLKEEKEKTKQRTLSRFNNQ